MATEYELSMTGADIDATLTSARDLLAGAATLPAAALPPEVVQDISDLKNRPVSSGGDATLRFSAVVRAPGATLTAGQPAGSYRVVWLDNSAAATAYKYKAPSDKETPLSGRFVAQSVSADDGPSMQSDTAGDIVSADAYYGDWPDRAAFCNDDGLPLYARTYLCTATGRQYDRPSGANGLRCIAAPPMDAKKALFNDLWNIACLGNGWGDDNIANCIVDGYYDPDTDDYPINGLRLTYAEAIQTYYAGKVRNAKGDYRYSGWGWLRTNLPPISKSNDRVTFLNAFQACASMEVANIGPSAYDGHAAFHGCTKLKKVIGTLCTSENRATTILAQASIPLEEIHLTWFGGWGPGDLNLNTLPNLNAASLEWMITNAGKGSKTRTVTLHADAYARLTDDMKARAAEKNITFVSAS